MLCSVLVSAIFTFSVAAGDCDSKQDEPWSYSGDNGPEHWGDTYMFCNSQKQSPISIDPETAIEDSSSETRLITFGYDVPLSGVLENNGHAVHIKPNDGISRGITANGVTYNLVHLHFHFGSEKDVGSEHIFCGSEYSMELHLVNQDQSGSLAVVGIVFKQSGHTNPYLTPITEKLHDIRYEDDHVNIAGLDLKRLFPHCIQPVFYTYDGSLTTPPCSEGVKWFVMNGRTKVSSIQMKKFRSLYSTKEDDDDPCPLSDNFRPVQELNGRVVTAYKGDCV